MLLAIRRASSLLSNFAAESPPRLILEIDVSELLPVVVAHYETGLLVVRPTTVAGSGVQPSDLRGLFDLQPAAEGVAKLIAQVGDLIGQCRIGIGLQQRLECIVDQFEVDLTEFVFFHGGYSYKAASILLSAQNLIGSP
jgi:hypothetical protein